MSLQDLRQHYDADRLRSIDKDFLSFEEEMSTPEDLQLMEQAVERSTQGLPNPHNSIMLYVLGLTDEFDHQKQRSDTIGGSPADIDLDFSSKDLNKLLAWIKEYWGPDHVANIGTYGVMKPRSFTDKYFRALAPKMPDFSSVPESEHPALVREYERQLAENRRLLRAVKDCIPDDLFGKSPTIQEVLEGNESKGYPAHPELLAPEFDGWRNTALKFEGLVASAGVHAAGIVVSDLRIRDFIPLMYAEDKESGEWRPVTQFTKDEVEELGFPKYDLLRTDNLAVLKLAFELVEQHSGTTLTFENIPDDDPRAYELLRLGYLQGVFQMEASDAPREIIELFQPQNLLELSDVSSINRPGPKQLNLHLDYSNNKRTQVVPRDMHPAEARILKPTYYTMVYQEQAMAVCSQIAGFSLKEADDVRRYMGKKDEKKLQKVKPKFLQGCARVGLVDQQYAERLWAKLLKYADYAFNKAHAVSYSQLTYVCAYLKAHHPLEFYTALLSVQGEAKSSKVWGQKGTAYLSEMRRYFRRMMHSEVRILGPSVNHSQAECTIADRQANEIRIGLSCLRGVGEGAIQVVLSARGDTPFKDVHDFLARVNKTKVSRKTFGCLVLAGCFDPLGYDRKELLAATDALYNYQADLRTYAERLRKSQDVSAANREIELQNQQRELLVAKRKRKEPLADWEQEFLKANKKRPARKVPEVPEVPVPPLLQRHKKLQLDVQDLLDQSHATGLMIHGNPGRLVYPQASALPDVQEDEICDIAGMVTEYVVLQDRNGRDMLLGTLVDEEQSVRFLVFSSSFRGWNESSKLARLRGKLTTNDRGTSFIAFQYEQYV